MPIRLGLIGKTNTGKTTFFNAATLSSEEISSYPFTTKNLLLEFLMQLHSVFIQNLECKTTQIIPNVLMVGDTYL